jgi:hypothetical protein
MHYSKSAHYQHVTRKSNIVSPSTPSTPSYSSGRRSLMTFLKNKDSSQSNINKLATSTTEGTLSTSTSGLESSDNHSMFQFPTQILDRRQSETTQSMASPAALPKRRSSVDPQKINNSNSLSSSFSGWDLEGGFGSKSTEKREDRGNPAPPSNSLLGSKHDSYRDPRRTSFHESKGSLDFNPLENDNDDDVVDKLVPEAAGRSRPALVATKSMPSPANSRLTLYSRKPSSRRGRSSSRSRDGISKEGSRDRSSSRLRTDRSSSGKGLSKGPEQPNSSDDPCKEKNHPSKAEQRHSSRMRSARNSRSPSKKSSRRTPSPMKIRIKDRATAPSPRSHRRTRASSRAPKEGSEEFSSGKQRSKCPSATSERKKTEGSSRRTRSSSRVRKEGTERRPRSSSRIRKEDTDRPSSRSRSYRSASVGKKKAKDEELLPSEDLSAKSKSSRGRGRSSSRLRTSGASKDDKEHKGSATQESGSRRTARERSRSRSSRPDSTLGELMKASSRRNARDSNRSVVSEPAALSLHVQKKTKNTEKCGGNNTVVSEPAQSQSNKEVADKVSPLKKRISLKGALSQNGKFNGNLSHGSISLSLDSVFSEKSKTSQKSGGSKNSYPDEDGEKSFQVVSSYLSGSNNRSGSKLEGSSTESSRYVGGNDKFENKRNRMSRGKVAEKNAQRSSRKNSILAALEQQDDEASGPLVRTVPLRTASGDGLRAVRPLMVRRGGVPRRSRSDAGGRLVPKLHMSLSQLSADSAEDSAEDENSSEWVDDSVRMRADFDKSFASFDF